LSEERGPTPVTAVSGWTHFTLSVPRESGAPHLSGCRTAELFAPGRGGLQRRPGGKYGPSGCRTRFQPQDHAPWFARAVGRTAPVEAARFTSGRSAVRHV